MENLKRSKKKIEMDREAEKTIMKKKWTIRVGVFYLFSQNPLEYYGNSNLSHSSKTEFQLNKAYKTQKDL